MMDDLSQPHLNGAPQFPGQPPNSTEYQQFAAEGETAIERCLVPDAVAAQSTRMREPA